MNKDQIRIKIAEACGWFFMDDSWHYPNGAKALVLPDYLNDLNAMHEAEKVLTYEQFDEYHVQLAMKMVRPFHAAASQRAEAFLRTLNLWKP